MPRGNFRMGYRVEHGTYAQTEHIATAYDDEWLADHGSTGFGNGDLAYAQIFRSPNPWTVDLQNRPSPTRWCSKAGSFARSAERSGLT